MEPELFLALRHIAINQLSIRLLNIYKGLPISYNATIAELGNDYLVVKTTKYQIVCLFIERETIIQSEYLPHSLSAKVLHLIPSSLEVVLSQIDHIHGGIGIRNRVRVEPDTPININIRSINSHSNVNAHIFDISQNGLCVLLQQRLFNSSIYYSGAKLILHFPLKLHGTSSSSAQVNTPLGFKDPMMRFSRERMRMFTMDTTQERKYDERSNNNEFRGEQMELLAEATLRYIRPELKFNRYRIGFNIKTNEFNQSILNQYISQRQSELITEIRNLYITLTK